MIVKIKFIDGSTSEYDISMSCTLLDHLTDVIDKGKTLCGFSINYNDISEEALSKCPYVSVINTKNVLKVTILKFEVRND